MRSEAFFNTFHWLRLVFLPMFFKTYHIPSVRSFIIYMQPEPVTCFSHLAETIFLELISLVSNAFNENSMLRDCQRCNQNCWKNYKPLLLQCSPASLTIRTWVLVSLVTLLAFLQATRIMFLFHTHQVS